MKRFIPIEEWEALGLPFLNLGDYFQFIEIISNWNNDEQNKKLNIEIFKSNLKLVLNNKTKWFILNGKKKVPTLKIEKQYINNDKQN